MDPSRRPMPVAPIVDGVGDRTFILVVCVPSSATVEAAGVIRCDESDSAMHGLGRQCGGLAQQRVGTA